MKSKSQLVKQMLLVFALMVGAISLFAVVSPIAGATEILSGNDNVVSDPTGGQSSLRQLVLTIVKYFLGFLGLLAVIMIIYGGVTYVISAGNDEAIGNAKKIIMYALIGLIVILLSFVIVQAVLGAGTGVEV